MFPSSALLSLLIVAVSTVNTTPIQRDSTRVTLGFAAKINSIGATTLGEIDRARASALRENALAVKHGKRSGKPVSATNAAVSYTASVGVGSPVTQYTLLIDTGSSNTWVGANTNKKYIHTHTSTKTKDKVSVHYGSGSFSGDEYIDQVTLGSGLVINKQSIGVATQSKGFSGVDGILGIGPVDLTTGTLSPGGNPVPTVVDNLFKAHSISSYTLGIFYEPATEPDTAISSGELSFGGADYSKIISSVAYVPITKTSPASEFWGIDQSVTYGTTKILSKTAGIVDTGTTLTLLATDAFNAYTKATGGKMDKKTGLLKITLAQFAALKPLNFKIGVHTYTLTRNAQIWPRTLNTRINGEAGSIYLIVGDLGTNSGQGLDFINGFTFLERFYSVYDTGKQRVGFATTHFTHAETN